MLEKGKYEQIGYGQYRSYPDWRSKYETSSLATPSQIACLMGLISAYRFSDGTPVRRVAEVGANSGVTSLYMLKAGTAARSDFKLYGIEKQSGAFFGSACRAEATPEELAHWRFVSGKTTMDIEEFLVPEEKLDMVFIDGAHVHPYPILDLLFLLPYLRKDALLIFHDVRAEIMGYGETGASCVYTAWPFPKYINWNVDNEQKMPSCQETMGILDMPSENAKLVLEEAILYIVRQEISAPFWAYTKTGDVIGGGESLLGLNREDIDIRLRGFMMKHYTHDFAEACCTAFLRSLEEYQENWIYRKNTTVILQRDHQLLNKAIADQQEIRRLLCVAIAEHKEEIRRVTMEQTEIRRYISLVDRILPYGSRRRRFLKRLLLS